MAINTSFFKIDPTDFALWKDEQSEGLAQRFNFDCIEKIFFQCLFDCDYKGLSALAQLNWNWYDCSAEFWSQRCTGLKILDAKAQGIVARDEPPINKLVLFRAFQELAPRVENGKGLTLLTMCKGTTLDKLVKIGAAKGMVVDFFEKEIPVQLGKDRVGKTYRILITNNIFDEKPRFRFNTLEDILEDNACEMPTIQEYLALITHLFNERVYCNPQRTFICSSTYYDEGLYLGFAVTPGSLTIKGYRDDERFSDMLTGGQRML